MAEDRVQLKQEEIVENGVVLNDINPKSNTKSIDDSSTGYSLDKTINHLWQSINNKLSRVVNSVNGRTGVVVLDAKDVGLGNVDNVSLTDIKKWVINRMTQEFDYKKIELFEYLDDVEAYISDNDERHQNKPFYSHHGFRGDDERAYIGYIWWDSGINQLKETHKVIDTIGFTNNSLIYNEGELSGGGLSVNIWKYEDALEIYNAESGLKSDSGLRINTDYLVNKVYYANGVYGNGNVDDENALLYIGNATRVPSVTFNIHKNNKNEVLVVNNLFLRKIDIKRGDIIITNFSDEQYRDNDGNLLSGMNDKLVNRQPCIGYVSSAPSKNDRAEKQPEELSFVIDFYQLHANVGWGLTNTVNHINDTEETKDTEISIQLMNGIYDDTLDPIHVSGLGTFKHAQLDPGVNKRFITMLPDGAKEILSRTTADMEAGNGLMITPNYSMCVIPLSEYARPKTYTNWDASIPGADGRIPLETKPYMNNIPSLLSVNLLKSVVKPEDGPNGFVNISGLKIEHDDELPETWGGGNVPAEYRTKTSGGIAVNVGNFLEIGSVELHDTQREYYDSGKVNVRIDTSMGLYDSGNNKIGINTAVQSGLKFNDDGQLQVNPGRGMIISPDGKLEPNIGQYAVKEGEPNAYPRGLRWDPLCNEIQIKLLGAEMNGNFGGLIFDNEGYLRFNPKVLSIQDGTNVIEYDAREDDIVITLGPGLKISK